MDPFPPINDIEEIYIEDNTFYRPFDNPYRNKLFINLLESVYQRFGTDWYFVARKCLGVTSHQKHRNALGIVRSTWYLLQVFKTLEPGIAIVGVDIEPDAKRNAPAEIGPHIITGDLLSLKLANQYNIITIKFVLEHLLDFRKHINKAVKLLAPGGIFFVSVPDIESLTAKQLKHQWKLIDDPVQRIGHIHWFTRQSLELLAS